MRCAEHPLLKRAIHFLTEVLSIIVCNINLCSFALAFDCSQHGVVVLLPAERLVVDLQFPGRFGFLKQIAAVAPGLEEIRHHSAAAEIAVGPGPVARMAAAAVLHCLGLPHQRELVAS